MTDDISAQPEKVKTIKVLNKRTSKIHKELENVKGEIKTIDSDLKWVLDQLKLISVSAMDRASNGEFGCKWIDKDGVCTRCINPDINGFKMKEVNDNGSKGYLLDVIENPFRCTACPKYERRKKV